jgi:hypothetical protein
LDFNFEFRFDPAGNVTAASINGIVERIHLPDGSLFISAGKIDYSADGFPEFVIAPDHGGIQNLDGFCAALAAFGGQSPNRASHGFCFGPTIRGTFVNSLSLS